MYITRTFMSNIISKNKSDALKEIVNLGYKLFSTLSSSIDLLSSFEDQILSSSYSKTSSVSSFSLTCKNVAQSGATAPTGAFQLVRGSTYPITASVSRLSVSSSYISGSMKIDGVSGYFPMFVSSSLTKTSAIFDGGNYVFVDKPVFASNLPVKASTSTVQPVVSNTYIPIVLDGVTYKLALIK